MLWRVGHRDDPAGFVPHSHTTWASRWDDARRQFRTAYAAEDPDTALIEVFRAFLPTVQAQRTREFLYASDLLFEDDVLHPAREQVRAQLGPSRWAWRALVPVEVETDAEILDVTQPLEARLDLRITEVLDALGIKHVTTHVLTSPDRSMSQAIARALYDADFAGVRYRSNLNDQPCTAVFEGRGHFRATGPATEVGPDMDEERQLRQAGIVLAPKEDHDNIEELASRGT